MAAQIKDTQYEDLLRKVLDTGIPKGDRKCSAIAAASIVAKVTRDRQMLALHAAGGVFALDRLGRHHGGEIHLVALVGSGVDVGDVVGDRRQRRGVGHQARNPG